MALSSVGAPPAAVPRRVTKRRAALLAISLQCPASCPCSCASRATRSQVRCASCWGAAPAPSGNGPKDGAAPNPLAKPGDAALAAANQGPADCEVFSQASNCPASGPASEDQAPPAPAPATPALGMPKLFRSSKKRSAALAKAASGLKAPLVKGVSMLYALPKTRSGG